MVDDLATGGGLAGIMLKFVVATLTTFGLLFGALSWPSVLFVLSSGDADLAAFRVGVSDIALVFEGS
jgi:hypothetical protein